jgi:hypothetical protein
MRLKPEELFIENLAGNISKATMQYMPKERALELLRKSSGQDFGYDVAKWREWLRHKDNGDEPREQR